MPAAVGTDGDRLIDETDQTNQMNKTSWVHVFGVLLAVWPGMLLLQGFDRNAWAESSVSQPGVKPKANVERGRNIFHGKGACAHCHGMDGYLDRLSPTKEDIAARIARLSPPPTDLRDPGMHRLKTNKDRARAIREGHPGTGMFPDFIMTDQNMADTLFYLAFIRKDPNPEQ
jgi:mono/diheme cytochrome c family protein